ncbi:hypothetical protein D3C73_1548630 [compost metagenome]
MMQLSIVVLPDPFMPMMPRIEPRGTCMSTPCSATRPPKRFLRFVTFNMRPSPRGS